MFDGPQKFICAFSDTVGEGHGSNMDKADINLSFGGTSKVSDPFKASGYLME